MAGWCRVPELGSDDLLVLAQLHLLLAPVLVQVKEVLEAGRASQRAQAAPGRAPQGNRHIS